RLAGALHAARGERRRLVLRSSLALGDDAVAQRRIDLGMAEVASEVRVVDDVEKLDGRLRSLGDRRGAYEARGLRAESRADQQDFSHSPRLDASSECSSNPMLSAPS